MNTTYFTETVKFLNNFIDTEVSDNIPPEFKTWNNIALVEGKIICSSKCDVGDLLHEAGHLATCPSEIRHLMTGDIANALANIVNSPKKNTTWITAGVTLMMVPRSPGAI